MSFYALHANIYSRVIVIEYTIIMIHVKFKSINPANSMHDTHYQAIIFLSLDIHLHIEFESYYNLPPLSIIRNVEINML